MDNSFLHAYRESCKSFEKAMIGLDKSFDHCQEIGIKAVYDFNETEAFDALIIKLTRKSDVFFQQILKGFFKLKGEDKLFFIDKLNFLEKMKVIDNSDELMALKSFRNQAVHEYSDIEFLELYAEALSLTPIFKKVVNSFMIYIENESI